MISEQYLRRLKSYCCGDFTSIENYEKAVNDTSQKWHCHHRKELTEDGKFAYSMKDLIKMKEYYGRPPEELIFLTESEHRSLHAKANKGNKRTAETRVNLSKSMKGKRNALKHHDITVSYTDDPKAYKRALYLKNKDEINAKAREMYHKKKALTTK